MPEVATVRRKETTAATGSRYFPGAAHSGFEMIGVQFDQAGIMRSPTASSLPAGAHLPYPAMRPSAKAIQPRSIT